MINEVRTVEEINEYESAAEWCALRGLRGVAGDRLPDSLSATVADDIDAFPEEFQARVRDYAYGIAMEKLALPDDPA